MLDAKEEPLSEASSQVYRRLRLPDSEVRILLQRTDDPKQHKERMHLDLESTVKTHVKRILAKIDARDRAQAAVVAYWGEVMYPDGGS